MVSALGRASGCASTGTSYIKTTFKTVTQLSAKLDFKTGHHQCCSSCFIFKSFIEGFLRSKFVMSDSGFIKNCLDHVAPAPQHGSRGPKTQVYFSLHKIHNKSQHLDDGFLAGHATTLPRQLTIFSGQKMVYYCNM